MWSIKACSVQYAGSARGVGNLVGLDTWGASEDEDDDDEEDSWPLSGSAFVLVAICLLAMRRYRANLRSQIGHFILYTGST